jgi:hypothetical protein
MTPPRAPWEAREREHVMRSFVPPRPGASGLKSTDRFGRAAAARPKRAPRQLGSAAAARREDPAAARLPAAVRAADGLPEGLRTVMEAMSGFSLADVVVHRRSAEPARLGAAAFTKGDHIHVAPGEERHLPHEAWHVVQQKQGRVSPTSRAAHASINDDPALEREADRMGDAASLRGSRPTLGSPANPVARPSAPSAVQCLAVIQLMRTTDQRRALAVPFLADGARLRVGYLTAESNVRDASRDTVGAKLPAGAMIVFDGRIRDNFGVWGGTEKDHVYAAVVGLQGNAPIVNAAQWREGWIVYEHVDADAARTANLQAALGVALNVRHGIVEHLTGLGNALPQRSQKTRAETAPAAIKAWAEKTGTSLATPMPLDDQQLHGMNLQAALAGQDDPAARATIDPQNELALGRLDPNHALFGHFRDFLNANAAAMPGTMAKDHELRNANVGGERANAARAWLEASGLTAQERDAELIAVTGADVTNIFVNAQAPTWAAYTANVAALAAQMPQPPQVAPNQPQVVPAPAPAFRPWQTLHDQGPEALQAFVRGFSNPRPGEFYLFHGTGRANVFNISKTGFDPEFVNYTFGKGYGKTGYGTAFTDQFAKALAYAPPEAVQQPQDARQPRADAVEPQLRGSARQQDEGAGPGQPKARQPWPEERGSTVPTGQRGAFAFDAAASGFQADARCAGRTGGGAAQLPGHQRDGVGRNTDVSDVHRRGDRPARKSPDRPAHGAIGFLGNRTGSTAPGTQLW